MALRTRVEAACFRVDRLRRSKIEKEIQRENVVHVIESGLIDVLIHVPDFDQHRWLHTVADPGKSTVLIKPLPGSPIRIIQMDEDLIPPHETHSRIHWNRPAEFEHLPKPPAGFASIGLPALFKSGAAGEGAKRGRP